MPQAGSFQSAFPVDVSGTLLRPGRGLLADVRADLAPEPGRWRLAAAFTLASLCTVVLCYALGVSPLVMAAAPVLTLRSNGHSLRLAALRLFLIGAGAVLLVSIFSVLVSAPLLLFMATAAVIWCALRFGPRTRVNDMALNLSLLALVMAYQVVVYPDTWIAQTSSLAWQWALGTAVTEAVVLLLRRRDAWGRFREGLAALVEQTVEEGAHVCGIADAAVDRESTLGSAGGTGFSRRERRLVSPRALLELMDLLGYAQAEEWNRRRTMRVAAFQLVAAAPLRLVVRAMAAARAALSPADSQALQPLFERMGRVLGDAGPTLSAALRAPRGAAPAGLGSNPILAMRAAVAEWAATRDQLPEHLRRAGDHAASLGLQLARFLWFLADLGGVPTPPAPPGVVVVPTEDLLPQAEELLRDPLSTPVRQRVATKGTIATMALLIASAVWPFSGVLGMLATSILMSLPYLGQVVSKAQLRLAGEAMGAAACYVVLLAFVPSVTDVGWWVFLLGLIFFAFGWMYAGRRYSYAGMQGALMIFITLTPPLRATVNLEVPMDRLLGVFIGAVFTLVVWEVFWPLRARDLFASRVAGQVALVRELVGATDASRRREAILMFFRHSIRLTMGQERLWELCGTAAEEGHLDPALRARAERTVADLDALVMATLAFARLRLRLEGDETLAGDAEQVAEAAYRTALARLESDAAEADAAVGRASPAGAG